MLNTARKRSKYLTLLLICLFVWLRYWETYERLLITTHTQNYQTHESSKTSSHVCNMLYGILISSESDTIAYTIYYFSPETYFSQNPCVSIILGIYQFLFKSSISK